MAEKIGKVNWVICPKCKLRYYVGPSLLMVEGIPAICPKCRTEFDPKERLESVVTEAKVTDRLY